MVVLLLRWCDAPKVDRLRHCGAADVDHRVKPKFQIELLTAKRAYVVIPAGVTAAGTDKIKSVSAIKRFDIYVKRNCGSAVSREFEKVMEGADAFQVFLLDTGICVTGCIQVPAIL